jgi:hypothetical protein
VSDYRRIFETGETIAADPADLVRALERLRRPGGAGTAVNPYPGPLLESWTREPEPWEWPWSVDFLIGRMPNPYRHPPYTVLEQRDRNAGWGMWPFVAHLEYEPVYFEGLWVPAYVGDPERATWRRRKWWGRGPIHFDPTGLRRGAAPTPHRNVRTGEIVWGEVIYAPRSFGLAEIIRSQGEVDR